MSVGSRSLLHFGFNLLVIEEKAVIWWGGQDGCLFDGCLFLTRRGYLKGGALFQVGGGCVLDGARLLDKKGGRGGGRPRRYTLIPLQRFG